MNDDEIILNLRVAAREASATAVAEALERLTGRPLSHAALITYLKRAIPEIPLQKLHEAGLWHRLGAGGEMSDDDLNELLGAWLPTPAFDR